MLGVSLDTSESHEEFARQYNLPFTLLSDVNGKAAKDYGTYVEKMIEGEKSCGILRTTFIINAEGQIEKVFRDVKVDSHALDVLQELHLPNRSDSVL